MKRIILSLAVMAAILSCAKEQETIQTITPDGSERVCASAADFICGNELTKTVITQEGADAPKFAWKEGDVIGVIPMNNETIQSNYEISEISSDPKEAMFDGGVWALKEGKEYAAYYPYQYEAIPSGGSLTFSFLGQTQSANNSLAHLGAYDYMYASSVIPAAGVATFQFKHLISLVRLQLTVPVSDTYKSVSLESDNAWFASKASLKLSDGTATGSDYLKNYTLNLNDINISSGNILTLWFAVLPTAALKDNKLSVKLFSATDNLTGEISIPVEFKAGSAYSYSCVLESSGVDAEYVDLGLSVKWASCNLGAKNPEEYGGYYQWAGLEDVTSTDIYLDYSNCPYHTGSSEYTGWTKYIPSNKSSYWSGTGRPDNKTVLDSEDDVAHVTLCGDWRIPTNAEWTELRNNCTWERTSDYNGTGVKGYVVTSNKSGYTDKSIFLPAAGYRGSDNLFNVGSGYYWSSSLSAVFPFNGVVLGYGGGIFLNEDNRYRGCSVRPVMVDMSTHTHSLTLINGQTPTTTSSGWKSYYQCAESLCGQYFEDAKGEVLIGDEIALAAWKAFGGRGYLEAPEYVDLGLSVKWATWNLGATKPEDYGGYYQWAGLEDVTSTDIYLDCRNCPYHSGTDNSTGWTKYIPSDRSSYWSGTGSPDNKTVLDPEDDVAHVTLGGNWRMPTDAEWTELRENCTWTWTSDYCGTEIAGNIVTSNKLGYTDKSIFLPAAGYRGSGGLYSVGSYGYYWYSSLNTDFPNCAYLVYFYSDNVLTYDYFRYYCLSVRPVQE